MTTLSPKCSHGVDSKTSDKYKIQPRPSPTRYVCMSLSVAAFNNYTNCFCLDMFHTGFSPSFIQQSFHFHSWSFNTNNILPAPCHNIYHSTQVYYLYPGHQHHRTQYNFILQDRYQSLMRKVFSLSTTYALHNCRLCSKNS